MDSPGKNEPTLETEAASPSKSPRSPFWPSRKRKFEENSPKSREAKAEEVQVDSKVGELSEGWHGRKSLKFRVTFVAKSQLGKNFYFRGADESGERIFKAFEKEKSICSEIEVYTLSGFQVQPPRNESDYEIALTRFSKLAKLPGNNEFAIPFERVELAKIQAMDRGSLLDVMGIILEIQDMNGHARIVLTDETKEEVFAHFWIQDDGTQMKIGDLALLRRVKKGADFEGMPSLNVNFLSHVWVNPEREDANNLRKWFKKEVDEEGAELV